MVWKDEVPLDFGDGAYVNEFNYGYSSSTCCSNHQNYNWVINIILLHYMLKAYISNTFWTCNRHITLIFRLIQAFIVQSLLFTKRFCFYFKWNRICLINTMLMPFFLFYQICFYALWWELWQCNCWFTGPKYEYWLTVKHKCFNWLSQNDLGYSSIHKQISESMMPQRVTMKWPYSLLNI